MFSGQPNPRWLLNAVDESWVAELLRGLPPVADRSTGGRPAPPGLGYRGFVFELDHRSWRAWRGLVWDASDVLCDRTRSVEKILVSYLPGQYDGVRTRVLEEIDREP